MQQPVPSGDVFKPSASVSIGALAVDASSVSVQRELPDPLAGGSLSSATASIVATVGSDVESGTSTPWDAYDAWPPRPESPARVDMNVGPGDVRSLTGRVQEVSGGTGDRSVSVDVADLYQTLDRTISWGPLSDMMPDPAQGAQPRYVGLHSAAITDQILRHCGWYATPPRVGFTVFSVPAMGTMWPENGTLVSSNSFQHPEGGVYPFFNTSSWGLGVNRVDAVYTFASYSLANRSRMEMTVMTDDIIGAPDRNSSYYRVSTSGGQYFSIAWTPTTVNVWTVDGGGNAVLAGTGPRVPGALIYVKVDRTSGDNITCHLMIDGELVNTRSISVHTNVINQGFSRAEIRGDMLGGGFQLAYPGSTQNSLNNWSPTATIHRGGTSHMLKFRPQVAGENCADLLWQQCEAQGGTFWIDEHGVLQWWDLQELERRGDEFTVTSEDNVSEEGFSWSHALSSVKSRVVVKWTDHTLRHSLWSRVHLWQGTGETVTDGGAIEEFINVPDDEIWIEPDLAFTRIGDGAGSGGASTTDFNRGRRSWWGGVLQDADDWAYPGSAGFLTFSIERITGDTFKYSLSRQGAVDAEMRTPGAMSATSVSRNKRSFALPILRGKMKYELVEMEYASGQTGPSTAPEHVIDGGWWIQEPEQAARIADYAAARLCVPHPELSAVSLVMIPGVQLGDIVTVEDKSDTGLTIRGIVTADSRSMDDSMGVEHSISVRPLQVTKNRVKWHEWGQFVSPSTWEQWGTDWQNNTWQQWGINPLAE